MQSIMLRRKQCFLLHSIDENVTARALNRTPTALNYSRNLGMPGKTQLEFGQKIWKCCLFWVFESSSQGSGIAKRLKMLEHRTKQGKKSLYIWAINQENRWKTWISFLRLYISRLLSLFQVLLLFYADRFRSTVFFYWPGGFRLDFSAGLRPPAFWCIICTLDLNNTVTAVFKLDLKQSM